ncbi:AraC family transcriptional regulator [Erythrobacter sp.]|uniref:helix-turn-helix domain-containing protein n=1 Tax=Erythrobacter sp. TaxID=1042 RepID=UPI0025FEE1CA|nr:AraC family transcriptional regulator [Erythrobacter sp.]
MAITEIRSDDPLLGPIDPVPTEDAYLVSLMLRNLDNHEVWENRRPCPRHSIGIGEFHLRDLKIEQSALVEQPHHSLQFYLPRAALDAIADENEARPVGELSYRPGVPFSDPVVRSLGMCLGKVFERPQEANRLFLDHIAFALGTHLAQSYGEMEPCSRLHRGGLAAWQERRATEYLGANLGSGSSLKEIAAQCGLSISHFSRAFKATFGIAPHQWLIRRRIEVAKALLKSPSLSLARVALECGFADQSHFTRVFTRIVGMGPGAWRRNYGIGVAVGRQ